MSPANTKENMIFFFILLQPTSGLCGRCFAAQCDRMIQCWQRSAPGLGWLCSSRPGPHDQVADDTCEIDQHRHSQPKKYRNAAKFNRQFAAALNRSIRTGHSSGISSSRSQRDCRKTDFKTQIDPLRAGNQAFIWRDATGRSRALRDKLGPGVRTEGD